MIKKRKRKIWNWKQSYRSDLQPGKVQAWILVILLKTRFHFSPKFWFSIFPDFLLKFGHRSIPLGSLACRHFHFERLPLKRWKENLLYNSGYYWVCFEPRRLVWSLTLGLHRARLSGEDRARALVPSNLDFQEKNFGLELLSWDSIFLPNRQAMGKSTTSDDWKNWATKETKDLFD